ncbi:MAG: gliding-associated putative ABC transporter substrate-binding component GldG [Bacteroidia bacterium]|jgi:gliding-associated putative ABC transporter substrate-binding component GldG
MITQLWMPNELKIKYKQMKKSTVIIRLSVVVLILVVLNLITSKVYFRLDFTDDERYTLSDATLDILENLDDVITVKAYFSEDLPTQLISNRQDFEDLLLEYENRSGGNIVFEFISPNDDPEAEQEAQQNGIQPIMVNVQEKDQVQQLRAYMGAVLMMGDQKEMIPLIQPGVSMEYDLTTSIKKISVADKPKIALLQGHGEPGLQEVAQLAQQLSVLYGFEPYTISGTEEIPTFYKAVVIINPIDTIPGSHFGKLDNFIAQGGNIFLSYTNLKPELQQGRLGISGETGFTGWLANKGINMGRQYVIDDNSGTIGVQGNNGMFKYTQQIKFPYFPRINKFPKHPATKGLEDIMLPFASPLTYSGTDSLINFSPLLMTSNVSGVANAPVNIDINKKWSESDFTQGEQVVALALDGPIGGTVDSRFVVISNASYVVNGSQQQQVNADNVNFTSNAIDWLSDDTGLIDLRTKGISSRPLDTVEDATREMLKYGNVLGPIFLILIYAVVRKQRYNMKKNKWREGTY